MLPYYPLLLPYEYMIITYYPLLLPYEYMILSLIKYIIKLFLSYSLDISIGTQKNLGPYFKDLVLSLEILKTLVTHSMSNMVLRDASASKKGWYSNSSHFFA